MVRRFPKESIMLRNILTIDFEDYYSSSLKTYSNLKLRIETKENEKSRLGRLTATILDLLKRHNVKATFFVVGYLGEKYPDLIEMIHKHGHHIGSHSYQHDLIRNMSEREFAQDLKKSIDILRNITNKKPDAFRAPVWSYDPEKCSWFWKILNNNGIVYDSSIFPSETFMYGDGSEPRFLNKREFGIIEIPPSTIRFLNMNIPFCGGFYLRAIPYWIVKSLISLMNNSGNSVVIYFHPYDIDKELVKIEGQNKLNNIINHYNVKSNLNKLENLLHDFKFFSFSDYFYFENL